MTVRAKFKVDRVSDHPNFQQKIVSFRAVTDGSEENKSFAKYTPAGDMNLTISYETDASNFFEEGEEYFLDISKAE